MLYYGLAGLSIALWPEAAQLALANLELLWKLVPCTFDRSSKRLAHPTPASAT